MKGIVLAGGRGTRLSPLTDHTNKCLLPVGDRPLIHYPIEMLRDSGIDEICVVARSEHAQQFVAALGNGERFGVDLTFKFQHEATGIGGALGLCRRWAGSDGFAVMLGDTILERPFRTEVDDFRAFHCGARIFITRIDDPSWCGVVELDGDGTPVSIEEKPSNPKSNTVAIGLYFYDADAWSYLHLLKPSARGELEITDLNSIYLEKRHLRAYPIRGWWIDAGTDHAAYAEAARLLSCNREAL